MICLHELAILTRLGQDKCLSVFIREAWQECAISVFLVGVTLYHGNTSYLMYYKLYEKINVGMNVFIVVSHKMKSQGFGWFLLEKSLINNLMPMLISHWIEIFNFLTEWRISWLFEYSSIEI